MCKKSSSLFLWTLVSVSVPRRATRLRAGARQPSHTATLRTSRHHAHRAHPNTPLALLSALRTVPPHTVTDTLRVRRASEP